eukprot:gene9161-18978_t
MQQSFETKIMIAAVKEEVKVVKELLEECCNDKIRAWCTIFPNILKNHECMNKIIKDFNPINNEIGSDTDNDSNVPVI